MVRPLVTEHVEKLNELRAEVRNEGGESEPASHSARAIRDFRRLEEVYESRCAGLEAAETFTEVSKVPRSCNRKSLGGYTNGKLTCVV